MPKTAKKLNFDLDYGKFILCWVTAEWLKLHNLEMQKTLASGLHVLNVVDEKKSSLKDSHACVVYL